MTGLTIGIMGLALCALICGIGSGLGLRATGSAAAGVLSEDPNKFSKVIVLALLPATQGIYGFVIAILGASYLPTVSALTNAGILDVVTADQIVAQGWNVFWATVPMMIGGGMSGYLQGKSAATTIISVGKRGEIASKSIIFPAMIEFYALLGLVVSIMMFANMPIENIDNITRVVEPILSAPAVLPVI